jgi:hypothetical protein
MLASLSVVLYDGLMIGMQCALFIFNPYPLGDELEGITSELQGVSRVVVSFSVVNGHFLILRNPLYNICHPLRCLSWLATEPNDLLGF